MRGPLNDVLLASCSCGLVKLEAVGTPISTVICYCDDCQGGARQLGALPNARTVQEPDGGTPYIVYRKDRVKCVRGDDLLRRYKLRPTSATNRVVAGCCNSPMFLSFDDSKHWLDVYPSRFQQQFPRPEMRICTRFRPSNDAFPDDVPAYAGYPLRLLAKLVAAKLEMLVRR